MASIKNFKKDINIILSDIIEDCYIAQLSGDEKVTKQADKIIDEAIATFDSLVTKINQKGVENKKKHFKALETELGKSVQKLNEKITKLSA